MARESPPGEARSPGCGSKEDLALEPATDGVQPAVHDAPGDVSAAPAPAVEYEAGDEIYEKFTSSRKSAMVAVMSFWSFLATVSSTSILAASPEVVATFGTSVSVFNVSNALYMAFMGLSPLFYGPLSAICGRVWPIRLAAVTFVAFSAGTAAAPNLPSYFVFRVLTAFQGTCFLSVGASVLGDIYRPVERGTAYGWFQSGMVAGPAFGPFLGGLIVTYSSWRNIFWMQTAAGGLGTVALLLCVPESCHSKRSEQLEGLGRLEKATKVWSWINPWRVLVLFRFPNLVIIGLAAGSLVWNMYSLLTPIRLILNPRFGLSSPLEGSLFFLAPGCGNIVGTLVGGRWADRVVKSYIKKRGRRVPEDRLHSCLVAMGLVIPGCMVVYGWSVDKEFGGIPLPVVCMFLQGIAQMFCFPSLNTYCLDVMQKNGAEVIAGNFALRYAFGAVGTAVVEPAINGIGVGWFSTVSALFVLGSAAMVWLTAVYGISWRAGQEMSKSQ